MDNMWVDELQKEIADLKEELEEANKKIDEYEDKFEFDNNKYDLLNQIIEEFESNILKLKRRYK